MTITNLSDANNEIDRLKARVATLEDQALRDDAEIERLKSELRERARADIHAALARFSVQMDGHEAEARALGIDLDTPIPFSLTEPAPQ